MAEVIGRSKLISSSFYQREQRHRSQIRSASFVVIRTMSRSTEVRLKALYLRSDDFFGRRIGGGVDEPCVREKIRGDLKPVTAQMLMSSDVNLHMVSGVIGTSHKWWEKGIQPNMKEVTSAKHLVDSLANAGNKLVVLEFFSPGCGACKALHPKICQLAEQNSEVQFLQLNHEDHKSLAYNLDVHVLPFFRFYRSAQGRLCIFSCTNATIKKFKDALSKHSTERCSLGPAKGLEDKELMTLAANNDLGFSYLQAFSPLESDIATILADSKSLSEAVVTSEVNDEPTSFPLPLPSNRRSYQDREQVRMAKAER